VNEVDVESNTDGNEVVDRPASSGMGAVRFGFGFGSGTGTLGTGFVRLADPTTSLSILSPGSWLWGGSSGRSMGRSESSNNDSLRLRVPAVRSSTPSSSVPIDVG